MWHVSSIDLSKTSQSSPMSVGAIDPACPQAIFWWHCSILKCYTSQLFGQDTKTTSQLSELNWMHAGKGLFRYG